jgi:HD-like signal output (HDOD) protein/GGDEF domain-containing protein
MSPIDPRLEAILQQADHLPTLPAVALEVLRLCRAEETTLDDLARALSTDPALAARLLRFANSSLYASGEEVRTLQRATLVLGMKTVQLMSLSFSLVAAVPRAGACGAFDYARYWRRSLVRAVSARALAGCTALPAQDEAFLTGLLAEIGQVVLARCLAAQYQPVLEAARAEGAWPESALERRMLGFDHFDVGGALLDAWQLPCVLQLTLRHAGEPERLPPGLPAEVAQLVRVLTLASHATDLLTQERGGRALERVHALARSWFALNEARVGALLSGLEAPIREAAGMLELELPPGRTHEEILGEARGELVQRSLGQARQIESLRASVEPSRRSQLLADPAHVDALTGCASEAAFQLVLEHELRARLDGNLARPLGLLLVEIDRFGALSGEELQAEAQRALAGALARLTRKQDLAARLAPGRFAVLLGDATPFGQRALAARLRHELEGLAQTVRGRPLRLTASVAGACLAAVRNGGDGAALRQVVERLLARAQARGPGQTEVHGALLQAR